MNISKLDQVQDLTSGFYSSAHSSTSEEQDGKEFSDTERITNQKLSLTEFDERNVRRS